jgi:hypothetical protein
LAFDFDHWSPFRALKQYTPIVLKLTFATSILIVALGLPAQAFQKSKPSSPVLDGASIYKSRCASCHGDKAQGGAGYQKPLVGVRSAAELASFIKQTMPPGPKRCPPAEAETVATFLYNNYYSLIAQEKNRPARVSIARLTVKQFRNAVADLVGVYHPVIPTDSQNGLRAEYYRSRFYNFKDKVLERVDPNVNFDFGSGAPTAGSYDPHFFSILWQGSIYAPDTGEYEFVVKSDHATRFFLNEDRLPLIDGLIKSGNQTEFRGSVFLLGGRSYPMRLDFVKANQGVDDTEKQKNKPAGPASVGLLWRRPKLALETIPQRFLYNKQSLRTFVAQTPFPPDDRSIGYERGNSVSKEWDDATTSAAFEAANFIASNLAYVTGIPDNDPMRSEKLVNYCRQFVERAFRSPLTSNVEQSYIKKQFDNASNLENAVKRVVVLTLKSPRFLYREIGTSKKDAYYVASQLSFSLWDSLPDPDLLKLAASGNLETKEQILAQAEKMANSPRAWTKLESFLMSWLKVDEVPDIVKGPKIAQDFDTNSATDLRTSFELFLENTAWSKESDFRDLMTSQKIYLNGRLAKLYGIPLPADAQFQSVALDSDKRSGILTQPYLLSKNSYLETSSPIHRGVIIVRSLLGRTLQPPPSAFAPTPPSLHPDWTTRERVSIQTKPDQCNTCHGIINPLGFTLEGFDAIGRWRTQENGKPIDTSGTYLSRSGKQARFANSLDLAQYIINSDEGQSAFTEKLFQHLVKQPVLAYGPRMLPELVQSFSENRYSIRRLMAKIAVSSAVGQPGATQ